MAALRRGIKTVIIPKDNERDLEEIDQTVRGQLHFVVVSHIDTVLDTALNRRSESDDAIIGNLNVDVHTKGINPSIRQ